MKPYKSVKQCSEAEYTVNRSRFIGRCFPVESEEAALCLLGDIRKKHWDATHNCFAYRIGENAAARFSDDGEPGGTAGKPIMDVLTGRGLTNVLCVVTRYFGGILLGAGGLVRAYSKSAVAADTGPARKHASITAAAAAPPAFLNPLTLNLLSCTYPAKFVLFCRFTEYILLFCYVSVNKQESLFHQSVCRENPRFP